MADKKPNYSLDNADQNLEFVSYKLDMDDVFVNQQVRELLFDQGELVDRLSNSEIVNLLGHHLEIGNLKLATNSSSGRTVFKSPYTDELSNDQDNSDSTLTHEVHTKEAETTSSPTTAQQTSAVATGAAAAKQDLCQASAMTVKCGHDKRGFTIQLPAAQAGNNKISIVSGRDSDKKIDVIIAELTLDKPLCSKHEGNVFKVSPAARKITESGNKGEIKLQCEPWKNKPFSHIWLPSLKPLKYTITPNLCTSFNDPSVEVYVYPEIKWSWDVGLNLGGSASESTTHSAAYDERKRKLKQRTWAISGTVECDYDGKKHKLNTQFERYVDSTLESVKAARNVFESVLPKLQNDYTRTFSVTWTNIHLKYTSYFEEQKSAFDVDHVYEFTFGANPIIAIKYEADILEILLGLAKANPSTRLLADVLFAVKQQMREGVGDQEKGKFYLEGDVAILASIGAEAKGELSIKGRASEVESSEGKLEITIPLKIEGHAYIAGAFFYVKFRKGYKIGARSGFGGRVVLGCDEKGIYDNGGLFFTGVYLYYVRYEDAKGKIKSAKKYQDTNLNSAPSGVREVKEELEWIKPWPSKEDQVNKKRYITSNSQQP